MRSAQSAQRGAEQQFRAGAFVIAGAAGEPGEGRAVVVERLGAGREHVDAGCVSHTDMNNHHGVHKQVRDFIACPAAGMRGGLTGENRRKARPVKEVPMPLRSPGSAQVARDPVHHPLFARRYARISVCAETRMGMGAVRERLLSGLSGRVIEIGAGNGLNFAHYPSAVSEVVAIEPERLLRQLAVDNALRAEVPVDVVPGAAEALPVKGEAFDAAVLSLVLCSVRDVPRALAEVRRVLRPGGAVRFFEHGRGGGRAMALTQRALDRTLWPALSGGCHLAREPVAALRAAGFELGPYRRLSMPERGPTLPTSYCVLGTAWRAPLTETAG